MTPPTYSCLLEIRRKLRNSRKQLSVASVLNTSATTVYLLGLRTRKQQRKKKEKALQSHSGLGGYRRPRPSCFWGAPFRCLPPAFVSGGDSSFVADATRHFGFRQTPPLRSPKALSPLRPHFVRPQPLFRCKAFKERKRKEKEILLHARHAVMLTTASEDAPLGVCFNMEIRVI